MDYNLGAFFKLKCLNSNYVKVTTKDLEMVNKTITNINPIYVFCLKKLDNEHYLCACVHDKTIGNSIFIDNGMNLNLWISYDHFVEINKKFFKNAGLKLNNSTTLINEIINNNNHFNNISKLHKQPLNAKKVANQTKTNNQRKNKEIVVNLKKNKKSNKTNESYDKSNKEALIKANKNSKSLEKYIHDNKNNLPNYKTSNKNQSKINNDLFDYKDYYKKWNVNNPVSSGRGNF